MSRIAINKEAVIDIAKQMGFVKEHENTDRNFMRFRYKDAPQYDARFAIVIHTVVDMLDGIIEYNEIFQDGLIEYGKYLKEEELKVVINLS
jgi:hypothetical protein